MHLGGFFLAPVNGKEAMETAWSTYVYQVIACF